MSGYFGRVNYIETKYRAKGLVFFYTIWQACHQFTALETLLYPADINKQGQGQTASDRMINSLNLAWAGC